ncbi:hypothetical protein Fcan01_13246 [Folsomia candida]|uniref:C-factor n=1 Tax=Folsomia candida TaxID=158441 RepID=A0A226E616_FOLCA|nr:hypothetical protein Fcan01_13246 [Folsomia candida]
MKMPMSTAVKHIFITGANRGIGFQLIKKMLPEFKPEKVFATYRDPEKSKELKDFAAHHPNVQLIQLDIRDFDKYEEVAMVVDAATEGQGLNLLINNAGVTSKVAKITAIRKSELTDNFETNTIAPILLTKALLPLLEKASGLNPDSPVGDPYKAMIRVECMHIDVAALNAATRSMSLDFKKSKIIAVALHPGWVKTVFKYNGLGFEFAFWKIPHYPKLDSKPCRLSIVVMEKETFLNKGLFLKERHPLWESFIRWLDGYQISVADSTTRLFRRLPCWTPCLPGIFQYFAGSSFGACFEQGMVCLADPPLPDDEYLVSPQ